MIFESPEYYWDTTGHRQHTLDIIALEAIEEALIWIP